MQGGQRRRWGVVVGGFTALSLLGFALSEGFTGARAAGEGIGAAQAQDTPPGKRGKTGPDPADKNHAQSDKAKPSSILDQDASFPLRIGTDDNGGAEAVSSATPSTGAAPIPTALQHAQTAKVSRCASVIGQATTFTSAAPSATLSQWSSDRPDDHMFQALIGVGAAGSPAPRSAVVVVASPEGGGCDAAVVQVRPMAQSCAEIEAGLRRTGATLTNLSGMAVVQGAGTVREMLVPVPGAGCVVVGTGLALNK